MQVEPALGLYHPFIHFPSDDWVKLAALYWSELGRIVPKEYEPRDSEAVQALAHDGFIRNFSPAETTYPITATFGKFLTTRQTALRKKYAVKEADAWQPDPVTRQRMGQAVNADKVKASLAYIFAKKLDPGLRQALIDTGLALPARGEDKRWVGVHPRIAAVYMTALAEEMAHMNHFHPVSDDVLNHVAVSGWSVERLAQALLEGDMKRAPKVRDPVASLAYVAIQGVVPKDISTIPIERILTLRKDYGEELRRFQQAVREIAGQREWLAEVPDATAFEAHLRDASASLDERLKQLRKDLRAFQIDTVMGAIDMKITLPASIAPIAAVAGVVNPLVAGGAAVAYAIVRLAREQRARADKAMAESPAAYLLHLEEELSPASLIERVQRSFRRFAVGV